MGARWIFALMAMGYLNVFFALPEARAFPPDVIDLWVERLEKRIADANATGRFGEDTREGLYDGLRRVKRMRSEAVRDGQITNAEREAIRAAIGAMDMDIAEARFGPREELVADAGSEQRRRAKAREPANAPGTGAVVPAF